MKLSGFCVAVSTLSLLTSGWIDVQAKEVPDAWPKKRDTFYFSGELPLQVVVNLVGIRGYASGSLRPASVSPTSLISEFPGTNQCEEFKILRRVKKDKPLVTKTRNVRGWKIRLQGDWRKRIHKTKEACQNSLTDRSEGAVEYVGPGSTPGVIVFSVPEPEGRIADE